MLRTSTLLAFLITTFSCGVYDMPLPPDHQYVTAADAGPGAPFTQVECPSDDADAQAADIRRVCAVCLANTKWGIEDREVHYEYTNEPGAPFVVGPPIAFSGNTWTDSIITLTVPDAKAGDDILIRAWGNWQLNYISSPGDVVGKARVEAREVPMVGPIGVFNLAGSANITDDSGFNPLPHNEQYSIIATHRVIGDSDVVVTVQARSQDLTGGAGVATVIFFLSSRLDVTHVRRTAP